MTDSSGNSVTQSGRSEETRESFNILLEISNLLETGLSPEALAICIKLCEQGVDPEQLAAMIVEIRHQLAARQSLTNAS